MKMTRVSGERAQRCASNSMPVMYSIQISSTATGTSWPARCSKKAGGSANACEAKPAESSKRVRDFRTEGSSSTRQTTRGNGTAPSSRVRGPLNSETLGLGADRRGNFGLFHEADELRNGDNAELLHYST